MVRKIGGNKWLELREMIDPSKGVRGYTYSHETRCDGHLVSVLPYKLDADGNVTQVMVRQEVTPCWELNRVMSSITGGVEKDNDGELDPVGTAVLELKEEAGLVASPGEMVDLGTCRGVKSCDSVYHLYGFDASDVEETEALGDGSELEAKAFCEWVNPEDLIKAQDPFLAMLFLRLVLRQ